MEKKCKNILMLVESPNKCASLKSFLSDEYEVLASVGHISYIKDTGLYNLGIDIKNDFKAKYEIMEDKKEIVAKLKEKVKRADKIIIATDPDREGEAIAWHLKYFLQIPEDKYERVTYHEITKNAVLTALKNPRKIDNNLVDAAKSRQKLDKIVGYRLSNIARKNTGAISVGRCQSAGLKLLVDKELEIQNFKPTTYYELFLSFTKNTKSYRAKYVGTKDSKIEKFDLKEDAINVLNDCSKNNTYVVKNINRKERKISSKPPFTTSTLQQEASSKLGLTVKETMSCAQKLFEGITLNNNHIALISYHRTDSTEIAPEVIPTILNFIQKNYGEEYCLKTLNKSKKSVKKENVQDGHEAIRPINLEMTPEKLKEYIEDDKLLKIYTLIYRRTIASLMSDSIYSDTSYDIYNDNHKFNLTKSELLFDGFKRVYRYDEGDANDNTNLDKVILTKDELLSDCNLILEEKQTKAPKRYSEATFIKTLDKLGIGRPSTYASIVDVLLDTKRGYCTVEDKAIVPTPLGIKLSKFLEEKFNDIINIEYTANMEKQLDKISKGEIDSVEFLSSIYNLIEEDIKKISSEKIYSDKICPQCGGRLIVRNGKYGTFLGCSNYPKCKYNETLVTTEDNKHST